MQGSRWVANYYKQEGISTTSRPPPSNMPQKVEIPTGNALDLL